MGRETIKRSSVFQVWDSDSTGLPVSVQNAMRRSGGALLRRESSLVESWIDPGRFFLIGKMKKGFANRFDFLLDRLFPFWKYLK